MFLIFTAHVLMMEGSESRSLQLTFTEVGNKAGEAGHGREGLLTKYGEPHWGKTEFGTIY